MKYVLYICYEKKPSRKKNCFDIPRHNRFISFANLVPSHKIKCHLKILSENNTKKKTEKEKETYYGIC